MGVYIIAEIGNTHEGSVGLAKAFIKAAADCGADAVKFQTHLFSSESLLNAPAPHYFTEESRQSYFERTAFSLEQYKVLKSYAEKDCGIDFLSSPFSEEAVDFLEQVGVQAYKIPSGEMTNLPFLEKVKQTGKTVFLSSGMSSWAELDRVMQLFADYDKDKLYLLQCTSRYPCPPEKSGLNVIKEFKERYQVRVGFSDHTTGSVIPIAAVSLGAIVIEKHITFSHRMYGSDAKNSMLVEEFATLVQDIRSLESALSSQLDKTDESRELAEMKRVFQKSVVASSDLAAGQLIRREDLAFKKPGDGISAADFESVIGKKLKVAVKKDHKFTREDF